MITKEFLFLLPLEEDQYLLDEALKLSPLENMTHEAAQIFWMYRFYVMREYPDSLPRLLSGVDWGNRENVTELHRILVAWPMIAPTTALELLDAHFPDERVREYAVSRLEEFSDEEVHDYLLQLVQVLKYEPYHDSPLARFLIRRSLRNRRVGNDFYWFLRSEVMEPSWAVRFALILEQYIMGVSATVYVSLVEQLSSVQSLTDVANTIKRTKAVERRMTLKTMLSNSNLPKHFPLVYNTNVEVGAPIVSKCKFMDSKKIPLWVVLENNDPVGGDDVYVMFKSGDDLRQDILTLQMLRIMDRIWKMEGMNLELIPYACTSTGSEIGMLQVVLNAETVADIQQSYGGSTAAFKVEPVLHWLKIKNPTYAELKQAINIFTLSCAGYCVATYVLGIGDRHNDNIMVRSDGHLFHIDFGHFLGNIKRKFGIRRERAPFILTPDFVHVMGGKDSEKFKEFQDICVKAFLVLRRHANTFINLFKMMLSTGIPELQSSDDIVYLRDVLCLQMSEEDAAKEFRNLIKECLSKAFSTQVNWLVHNLVHPK